MKLRQNLPGSEFRTAAGPTAKPSIVRISPADILTIDGRIRKTFHILIPGGSDLLLVHAPGATRPMTPWRAGILRRYAAARVMKTSVSWSPTPSLNVVSVQRGEQTWTITVDSRQPTSCPGCGTQSKSRHSAYSRTLRDLSAQGAPVIFRKGANYGTIIVDLERRQVVDLLGDRSAATAANWFKEHPEVE